MQSDNTEALLEELKQLNANLERIARAAELVVNRLDQIVRK